MMRAMTSAATLWASLALLLGSGALHAQDYVVMGTPAVNLRTGPGTGFVIVSQAAKGDLFRITGETDGWWEIRMFSEAPRYVSKAVRVYPLDESQLVPQHRVTLPDAVERRRAMRRDVRAGLERAAREAEELLPHSADAARHTVLREALEDRIVLEVFHILGLQPAAFAELMAEERLR